MWWTELSTEEDKMEDNRTHVTGEKVEDWVYDSGPLKVDENYAQIENNLQDYYQVEGKLNFGDLETTEFDNANFTLLYEPENQMLAEFTGDKHFIMYSDEGDLLVDLNLSDHSMIFGDNYTPDKAAETFWETIGKVKTQNVDEAWSDYEKTLSNPAHVLREVRDNLGVPQGESIIEFTAPPGIADDMPSSYFDNGLEGWTLEEEEGEHHVSESAIDMVKKAIVNHKFDDAMKVID